jgi:pilus assembly protein CpaF
VEPVTDLDALAASLRERLLTESVRDGPGDVEGRIRALAEREAALLDAGAREALVARVAERSFGLGPLEPLRRDPAVDEVMVNGVGPVWVERAERLECTEARFASVADLRDPIERVLAPLGRRDDEAEPLCDARRPDRRRLHARPTSAARSARVGAT